MTHGHFLIMGGFILVDGELPKKPKKPSWFQSDHVDRLAYIQERHQYDEAYRRYNLGLVSPELFRRLVADAQIDFPMITAREIEDKSKGDILSKTLAILQTTWFMVQCIARGVQGLALTELELVTLALAGLNAATYFFWWHKPLGVQEPIKIYLKKTEHRKTRVGLQAVRESQTDGVTLTEMLITVSEFLICSSSSTEQTSVFMVVPVFLIVLFSVSLLGPFPLVVAMLLGMMKTNPPSEEESLSGNRRLVAVRMNVALHKFRHALTSPIITFFLGLFKRTGGMGDIRSLSGFLISLYIIFPLLFILLIALLLLLPFFILFFLISFLFTSVFRIITTDAISPGARTVPAFYAPTTRSDRYSRMIVFAFFGVIFGGLHAIGWYFEYPTHSERTIWRVTSLSITAIPLVVAPIDYFIANRKINPHRSKLVETSLLALDLIMTLLLFLYVPARLSLIAQALALLRAQPRIAFVSVNWTRYIPHLFLS